MRFNKILLISPPSLSRYGGLRVPAGIGHVAQALYDNSIDYEYVDMRIGRNFNFLMKKAKEFNPDLIGLSMVTQGYTKTYQLISRLKSHLPDAKIIVGGHHMTILKEKVLQDCGDIDFGVVGDGEDVIVDICKNLKSVQDIQGLIYRKNEHIIFNGHRPVTKNLDQYAFPRYDKFDLTNYSKQIPIHSSRGCVGQCTFCPNKLIGQKFRTKSIDYFVDEIEYWYRRGYLQFAIDDDNFTLIRKRVFEFCDQIEKRGLENLFIRCSNGIRADRVDRKMLERMQKVGVREVGFGVDGGNNKILTSLKKGESLETIERAIKDACDIGLDVKIFIIVGTPHETRADIEDSIRLAKKYPVARVNFNNAIPYPGTEMFDYVNEHKLFVVPPERYLNEVTEEKQIPVFETPDLSKEERLELLAECHRVEKAVMKNTAIRMYSRFPFAGILIKYFFNVTLFEKLFFKTLFLRNIFEKIRYRKLVMRQKA